MNKLMRIILILGVVMLVKHLSNYRMQPRGVSYTRYIWPVLVNIFENVDVFKEHTRFEPMIFITYVWNPIKRNMRLSREHFLVTDGIIHQNRRAQIPDVCRVIRALMWYSGWKPKSLVLIFKQSKSTISRDVRFIAQLINMRLYSRHIYCPIPGSTAYQLWLGAGVFYPRWPSVIYAVDVMKLSIARPCFNQQDFYDGHHHDHNIGYLVACNGWGWPCYIYGPQPGHRNDLSYYRNCQLYRNPDRFVFGGNYVFGDRIFRYYDVPMITPFHGMWFYTLYELLFNYYQSQSRVIIENLFGRFKVLWNIWCIWNNNLSDLDLHFRATMTLTCIIIKHQDPLRAEFAIYCIYQICF
eukprot:656061_1